MDEEYWGTSRKWDEIEAVCENIDMTLELLVSKLEKLVGQTASGLDMDEVRFSKQVNLVLERTRTASGLMANARRHLAGRGEWEEREDV